MGLTRQCSVLTLDQQTRGRSHEETFSDVGGLRRGDVALRCRACERAGQRGRGGDSATATHLVENFSVTVQVAQSASRINSAESAIWPGPEGENLAM